LLKAQEWYPLANESTIRNFRKYYLKSLAANPDVVNSTDGAIPAKKRGTPLLFGEYDKQIVEYVRRLRRHGAKVNRTIVMGSARGILTRKAPQLLFEQGGSQKITKTWAKSLLRRIEFVKRKGTRRPKGIWVTRMQWDANFITWYT